MGALFRGKPLRPAYTTPPTELPHADVEAQIHDVDERMRRELAAVAEAGLSLRHGDTRALFNRLLDLRNAIRPPRVREVPRVPGRIESTIANYQENPW